MTDDGSTIEPPVAGADDLAYSVVKGAISLIPVVGGPAVELFSQILQAPIERRREIWMQAVADAIHKLESEKGIKLEDLPKNESFIDTILQASQAAIRTSQAEKRLALRNAVLNSALPEAPDQSLQMVFLALIDQFSEWHLRLLKLFQSPQRQAETAGLSIATVYSGSPSQIVESVYPELKERKEFYDQVWRDLNLRGLVTIDGLHTIMTPGGMFSKRTTAIGDQFLSFIESPID